MKDQIKEMLDYDFGCFLVRLKTFVKSFLLFNIGLTQKSYTPFSIFASTYVGFFSVDTIIKDKEIDIKEAVVKTICMNEK